jgi:hypothetical protein
MRLEEVGPRLEQLAEWHRQVTAELIALPGTLALLREGAENFQRVTKRLLDATETLDQINQLQSKAIRSVRDQVASRPGTTTVVGALDELNDALSTLARVNPFWPRGMTRESPPGDG